MKKRALISVSDKNGLTEFAQFLEQNNYELISTGGTFKHLKEAGLNPIQIDEVTNFPEMLDGRVKTLHPKVHGGLLAVRDNEEHMKTVSEHEIGLIDMVIVNLYPFFENVNKNISLDEKVEFIDIGGPSMLRSAAKNFNSVAVITHVAAFVVLLRLNEFFSIRPMVIANRHPDTGIGIHHLLCSDDLNLVRVIIQFVKTGDPFDFCLILRQQFKIPVRTIRQRWYFLFCRHKGLLVFKPPAF